MNGLVLILISLGFTAVPLACFIIYAYFEYHSTRNPNDLQMSKEDKEYYDSLPLK
jgi:hypothetical protein